MTKKKGNEMLKDIAGALALLAILTIPAGFCESIFDDNDSQETKPIAVDENEETELQFAEETVRFVEETTVDVVETSVVETTNNAIYPPAMIESGYGYNAYEYELEYVAKIVWLESCGESAECQRAICEVIFNRLESGLWGDSLTDVIYSENQFETIEYIDTAEPTDDIRAMVYDVFEHGSTIDESVLFFRADYYHQWEGAVDEFFIDSTYFSSSKWCS